MGDVTEMLRAMSQGSREHVDDVFPIVYGELRKIATGLLRSERHHEAVDPGSLVHEVYLKLIDQQRADWKSRSHFFAVGAQAMRRILVDKARRRKRLKRGAGMVMLPLPDDLPPKFSRWRAEDVLTVDGLLTRLRGFDERQALIVEFRFFGGLTLDEVAEVMGVSRRTVAYEWRTVRAWMRGELAGSDRPAPQVSECE